MSEAEVKKVVLDNGLTIIGEPNKLHQSAAIGFFVKTGARDESEKESGVSHFLEHMMFKGTPKRTSIELTFDMGNIGAQSNAFTSEENTVYYGSIIPESFGAMQEILSDMLRPSLDTQEFDTEKNVILEEIALYQDRPHFYLFEHANKDYYGTHPAGNSVLGSTQSISDLKRDEMKAYFDRRYSPRNMTLVAAGKFSWDSLIADAKKYCDSWVNFDAPRKVFPHTFQEVKKEYKKKNLKQAHMLFMTEGGSSQDEERYPLALLSMILGDSSGSKLYWELIDTGIADSAGADADEKDGTGCFSVYASTEPKRLLEVSDIVRRILKSPLDFSDEDLDRAKTKLTTRIALNGELPMGRLMSLGMEWTYRRELHSLKRTIEKVKAITIRDIEKALMRYPLNKWCEFTLLPEV